MLTVLALALAGCGGHKPRTAALRIERADLVLIAHTLRQLEGPVQSEVAAARAVWPALAGGLPASLPPSARAQIALAERRAAVVALPHYLEVEGALTGPAAQLSGIVKDYAHLTQRGWGVIAVATGAGSAGGRHGDRGAGGRATPSAAAFLRANSGLYIYSVYDGHFDLALVGEKLQDAYGKLGGPQGFGGTLREGEVEALARAYSVAAVRLSPHPAGRVGV